MPLSQPVATFSIVACDRQNGDLGIAVASRFLAVGAVVPWAQAQVGAVATQSYANTAFGADGLRRLATGESAQQALQALLAGDSGRESRQVGIVDVQGGAATFTGSACHLWAGGRCGAGYACQGNILTGPEVVEAMAASIEAGQGSQRRQQAFRQAAGDAAGGDRRGRQSAALLVVRTGGGYGGFNDRYVDLRIDDHPQPIPELERLLKLHRLYFTQVEDSTLLSLDAETTRAMQHFLTRLGYYTGEAHGVYNAATRQALETWGGVENMEERLGPSLSASASPRIDPLVLDHLRILATK